MTAVKKAPISASTSYKLAAAMRRAKVAATIVPLERKVRPRSGWIRVVLSGKPISRDRQAALFGPSLIDIPQFGQTRKKMG